MKLREVVKDKNLHELHNWGGVETIAMLLETSIENGIDEDDLRARRKNFSSNAYKKLPVKGLMHFMVKGFSDIAILILLASSILSVVHGILEYGVRDGWYDGASNIFLALVHGLMSARKNARQERQLWNLSMMNNDFKVDVVRNGVRKLISVSDLVVGDVVFLRTGDLVPADGLFIDGCSLQVDEPSMTGERVHVNVNSTDNPFLSSGSDVIHGYSKMLVTSVAMALNTVYTIEQTPLQKRLDRLTSFIRKIGYLVAPVILLVMLIRYFKTGEWHRYSIIHIFHSMLRTISAITSTVIVAVPGGLDLAFKVTLANSIYHMRANQVKVRNLSACEAMGSTTVICTNKTGTLTSDQMEVTKFWIGNEEIKQDFSQVISHGVLELFYQGAAFNNAGDLYVPESGSLVEHSGTPIDRAIFSWAVQDLKMDIKNLMGHYMILRVESFNSLKKKSGVFIKRKTSSNIYVHQKGAAELVLATCSSYREPSGELKNLDETGRSHFLRIIQGIAASSSQCIAFAYKEMLPGESLSDEDETKDLVLLGIIGIKNPCRGDVTRSIKSCRDAGIGVTVFTGDNMFTAKAIATDCRILDANNQTVGSEEVIEGSELKNYTGEELLDRVDNIRVVARSSPEDELLMVRCLKQRGHVVAKIGDGINEADVSLTVGFQRGKGISDIAIFNSSFSSVMTLLLWGRCIYSNILKYIQFQLSVNIAILVANLIASISGEGIPLTTFHLLWINLVVENLGIVDFTTEKPCKELLLTPPIDRTGPIITNIMWRNLSAQALYQIAVLLTLQLRGRSVFKVDKQIRDTLVFNTYVLCQVFSVFNSRELENRNIFRGISKNKFLFRKTCIMIVIQVLLVELLGGFAQTKRLSLNQWGVCVAIASLTWLIGWIVKFVPVPKKPCLSDLENCRIQSLPAPEAMDIWNKVNGLVSVEIPDQERK